MSQRTAGTAPTINTPKSMRTVTTVALWALVGVTFLFSFAAMLSIGFLTMPLAVAGAVLLLVRPDRTRGWAVMLVAVSGVSLPMVLFSWIGGLVCRRFSPDPAVSCPDQANPWPWLAFAVVSLAAATLLFLLASRRDRTTSPGAATR
jgi:MFS family permease